MQSESMYRPSAAEFPHDNPEVDRGALWVGSALCMIAAPEEEPTEVEVDVPAAVAAAPVVEVEVPVAVAASQVAIAVAVSEPAEIVGTGIDRAEEAAQNAPECDPIAAFVQAVTEVALAYGPAETAAQLEALFHFGTFDADELSPSAQAALFEGKILEPVDGGVRPTEGFTSTSAAWRSILRGEPGDLSACGESTLDTWTADLVARLVASPDKASTIRRDLRRRGIAAFGMLS